MERSVIDQQLTPQNAALEQNNNNKGSHWLWPLLCAVLVLVCFIQAWFIFQLKKQPRVSNGNPTTKAHNLPAGKAWKVLQKSLTSSDPNEIRQAILVWGKSFTDSKQINTLDKIAEHSDDLELNNLLKQSFNSLEASLYKDNAEFNAQALAQHLGALKDHVAANKRKASNDADALKPLYKS